VEQGRQLELGMVKTRKTTVAFFDVACYSTYLGYAVSIFGFPLKTPVCTAAHFQQHNSAPLLRDFKVEWTMRSY
jgi:hypothetical protein